MQTSNKLHFCLQSSNDADSIQSCNATITEIVIIFDLNHVYFSVPHWKLLHALQVFPPSMVGMAGVILATYSIDANSKSPM
jgi:hypothetical protein